jgi:pyruvate dehydrogenase E1 component alpha subunit
VKECNERVQAAVQEYTATPMPAPAAMFEHLYAVFPAALEAQRAELDESASGPGLTPAQAEESVPEPEHAEADEGGNV